MATTDRNLLFGVLALQMDFVGREGLVGAMNAWALEKSRPLGSILVERGALDPTHRGLLEPLVDAHLARHGGDPAQSLAALDGATSVRDALAPVADADVQASLARLGGPTSPATSVPDGSTLTFAAGTLSSAGTRFRVLRPHARGGLGQVYVARDEELGRGVALKEIRADKADDADLRSRFVLEAEINGNLEHPGIVPVYGLGAYADGRPFYAMRFVEGDSLKEAVERFHNESPALDPTGRSLRLRHLLGRFVDVCEAVAYAHSRGVLHRDLKPANVMLGQYGETLVVDWGLAKATGRRDSAVPADTAEATLVPASGHSHDPTLAGMALGTPQYMSPEQAEGRLDRLGPATDVYGLGATLYALLTGRAAGVGLDRRGDAGGRPPGGDRPAPSAASRRPEAAGGGLHEGAGAAPGGPLPLRPRPGRRRRAVAGRRGGLRPPRPALDPRLAVGPQASDAHHDRRRRGPGRPIRPRRGLPPRGTVRRRPPAFRRGDRALAQPRHGLDGGLLQWVRRGGPGRGEATPGVARPAAGEAAPVLRVDRGRDRRQAGPERARAILAGRWPIQPGPYLASARPPRRGTRAE